MRRFIISFLITAGLFMGLTAFAAEGFIPIAPLPDAQGTPITSSTSLAEYINAVFRIALAGGAVLAVIMIAYGGFEYMLSQTLPGQKDGRARIQHALFGLAILILVFLILWVIGGDRAVSLDIFT